jgi:hypothetical protein
LKKRFFALLVALSLAMIPPVFSQSTQRGLSITPSLSDLGTWGTYHALIIGINDYKEWPRLQTAVKDATVIRETLVSRYGFNEENVILRTDGKASRLQIIADLRYLAKSMSKSDNLLVYYAGHGQLDDLTGEGYWVPAEGKLQVPGTWVANSYIKAVLSSEKVRAKNVIVIADSCYSGSMLRGGSSPMSMNDKRYREKLAKKAALRSRQVISSGGVEPVADGGAEGHSLFAFYLINALQKNDQEVIDLENLFHTKVWKPVTEIGDQRPNVGRLKTPMDQDGQFVLYNAAWVKEQRQKQAILKATPQNQTGQKVAVASTELELQRQRFEMEQLKLEKQKQELEYTKLQMQLAEMKQKSKDNEQSQRQTMIAAISPAVKDQNHSNNQRVTKDRYKLVLFPIKAYVSGGGAPELVKAMKDIENKVISGISGIAYYDSRLELAYTYKNIDDTPNEAMLLTSIAEEEDIQIWKKESFFSSIKPDWKKIKRLGNKIDANIGFMVTMQSNGPNGRADIYVYDFKRDKVYSKIGLQTSRHEADKEIEYFTRKLLKKFYDSER